MIDDYHNVHAKKVPTKLITSTAVHMASCLLDIHPTIPAVPHPQQTVHRPVKITIKGLFTLFTIYYLFILPQNTYKTD